MFTIVSLDDVARYASSTEGKTHIAELSAEKYLAQQWGVEFNGANHNDPVVRAVRSLDRAICINYNLKPDEPRKPGDVVETANMLDMCCYKLDELNNLKKEDFINA